ncbi:hypothetical protein [Bradyrhizobium sp. WSM3983]|uniref:hypothetical protein n=1 Tax=Bradyrhizobium sp. WSM3983 TaxID=1038867 RepID=UPI0012EBD5AA|nr:hypothetical protein [Bradyrhizobium sp. WSM3983]
MNDSEADFFEGESLLTMMVARKAARRGAIAGSNVMTFVGRLSVVTAYLAMAFVGAIVLGMI